MASHCQSSFLHGPLDVKSHYFGCLKLSERQRFLEHLPKRNQAQIREEENRTYQLRLILEADSAKQTREGILFSRHRQSLRQWQTSRNVEKELKKCPSSPSVSSTTSTTSETPIGNVDIFANMMFFKDSAPHTLADFLPEEFPDQKISLKQLLYDEDPLRNPLTRRCPDGMIRYFHVPGNDMKWVEELMACYYGETMAFDGMLPTDGDRKDWGQEDGSSRTKTQILLDQEVWRGQQRGPSVNDPVHTRSMRPHCDLIASAGNLEQDARTTNLVLFMPYLHWETYRARAEQARTIKSCDRGKRSTAMKFSDVAQMTMNNTIGKKTKKKQTRRWPFQATSHRMRGFSSREHHTLWQQPKVLGQVLLQAAKLAIAMDFYTEKTLLEHRLDLNPPLHPRRTLDQYYYWALKDIETQDKSQVVYRATAPTKHLPDQFAERDLECRECLQDIRTVPRLLMVDQLWLWVLDSNTVITFFPKRWGRTEDDSSDVHHRLRMRLKSVYSQEISSVYDLAIIIIDQCSKVFFDRSGVISLSPQVLEIFAHAIGDVSFKQITSFNHFLEYTRMFSVAYKARSEKGSVVRHQNIIDITVEVKLLQEVKDILDELMIMTTLLREQLSVSKTFARHVETLRAESAHGADHYRVPNSRTISRADDLIKSIDERIAELQRLVSTATDVSSALNELLALKQQQMGVVEARLEAREAAQQGRETVRHGRTIMLFTVVTIIFMPLSFVASIFGMNVAEFNDGNLNLRTEFIYMFPISLAFSAITLLVAFQIYTIP